MIIEETEFRKKPILVIKNDAGRRLFSAGFNKIKTILENIEILKSFFDKYNVSNI